ncbi:hypothetical protein [Desulfovibrio sp. JC022]|uniref:hypothetical protein n=1 Tax=Desulfovibrio sp. JC022 TaxID=2593642 RepID=UPI0013D7934D|nr:hypothetical protein [Desulfovibrio sp. JC022]NDV23961.1 hypothetical protein [Desulfovibrio sp. JC022]
MKKFLCFSLMLLCLLLGALLGELRPNKSHGFVIVENKSNEVVHEVEIKIMDLQIKIPEMDINGHVVGRFEIPGDSHYDILVLFKSGKKMDLSSGYMTNGLDSYDLFVITQDGIEHHSIPPFNINSSSISN